jgi:hypothetical protein
VRERHRRETRSRWQQAATRAPSSNSIGRGAAFDERCRRPMNFTADRTGTEAGMQARHSSLPAALAGDALARRWYHARAGARLPGLRGRSSPRTRNAGSQRAQPRRRRVGPRVLLATSIGSYAHAVTLESALAAALTFRGGRGPRPALRRRDDRPWRRMRGVALSRLARFVEHGPTRDLCRDCRGRPSASTRSSGSRCIATATG